MDQDVDSAGPRRDCSQKRKHGGHEHALPRKRARVEDTDEGESLESEPEDDHPQTSSESSSQSKKVVTAYSSVTSWFRKIVNLPRIMTNDQAMEVDSGESRQHVLGFEATVLNRKSSPESMRAPFSQSHDSPDPQNPEEGSSFKPAGRSKANANVKSMTGKMTNNPDHSLRPVSRPLEQSIINRYRQSCATSLSCAPSHLHLLQVVLRHTERAAPLYLLLKSIQVHCRRLTRW